MKSDKSLGPDVQTVGGSFLNVARAATYVGRIVYIELLNSESWYLGPRSSVGERRVF